MQEIKKSKLLFKGEKTKKRKHPSPQDTDEITEPQEEAETAWFTCNTVNDVDGPVIVLSTATEFPSILFAHPENNKVSFREIPDSSIQTISPDEIQQVFFIQKIPGSSRPVKYSIKSPYEKYVGVDKFGISSCERGAIGFNEEWELEKLEDGFSFKSNHQKYFKMEMLTRKLNETTKLIEKINSESTKPIIDLALGTPMPTPSRINQTRGDSDQIGILETFQIKYQSTFRNRQIVKKKAEEDNIEYALKTIKKFSGKTVHKEFITDSHVKEYQKAKQKGKLNETLLNQRILIKSDKYCK